MTNLELLDKHSICHKCQKAKQMPNRKFCAECLEKIALDNIKRYNPEKAHEYQARRRELYQIKKASGICVRCSNPATHGLYCYECSIRAKKSSQKSAARRKRERHERGLVSDYRKQNNLCCFCGEPVELYKITRACSKCREKFREISYRGNKEFFNKWRNAFWSEKIKK